MAAIVIAIVFLTGLSVFCTWVFTTLWGMSMLFAVVLSIVFSALYMSALFTPPVLALKIILLVLTIPLRCAITITFCGYMWGWNPIIVGALTVVTSIFGAYEGGEMYE